MDLSRKYRIYNEKLCVRTNVVFPKTSLSKETRVSKRWCIGYWDIIRKISAMRSLLRKRGCSGIAYHRLSERPRCGSTDYLSQVSNQQPLRYASLQAGQRIILIWFVTQRAEEYSADNRVRSPATHNTKLRDHSILTTTTTSYNYP